MGFRVTEASVERVVAQVPLAPNRNHLQTVFGGSLYSVAALTCYALFRMITAQDSLADDLVIQTGEISYQAPVTGDFDVLAAAPAAEEIDRFRRQLRRSGKARLALQAAIRRDGQTVAVFSGTYVMKVPNPAI